MNVNNLVNNLVNNHWPQELIQSFNVIWYRWVNIPCPVNKLPVTSLSWLICVVRLDLLWLLCNLWLEKLQAYVSGKPTSVVTISVTILFVSVRYYEIMSNWTRSCQYTVLFKCFVNIIFNYRYTVKKLCNNILWQSNIDNKYWGVHLLEPKTYETEVLRKCMCTCVCSIIQI